MQKAILKSQIGIYIYIVDYNLLASEHMRMTCLFEALKTLKNTGVNSSNFSEANVKSPNGPTPPSSLEPFSSHTLSGFTHLESNASALFKLENENVISTSACIKKSISYIKSFIDKYHTLVIVVKS